MGFLSTIGSALGASAASVITTLAVAEFSACAPSWAKKIVRRAARGLPESERTPSEAEWLSHIEDTPGNLSKLLQAFGLWRMVYIQNISINKFVYKLHSTIKSPNFRIYTGIIGLTGHAVLIPLSLHVYSKNGDSYAMYAIYISPIVFVATTIVVFRAILEKKKSRKHIEQSSSKLL